MRRLVASLIRHRVLANVILFILILGGFIASQQLVREDLPEISVDNIMVRVPWPGADVYEVEESIARKIEDAVDGLEGVRQYTTVSAEDMGRAIVRIYEDYPMDKAKDNIENAIDSISTFPPDAEKPIIEEITIKEEVILLSLWGDLPERTRKEFAERIKDDLQSIEGLSQVQISGVRDYEIGIEFSEERLREYGLTFADVARTLRENSLNLSGGTIRAEGEQIRLRTVGRKYTGKDFAEIVVLARPDGEIITLDRLATIRDGFTEDPIIATFNGKPAVVISVLKTEEEDAIAVARAVRQYVERTQPTLPEGMKLTPWVDRSQEISSRLNILLKNGTVGLVLVLASLWLFLNWRLSFWVAMGIPISLSGALIIMWLAGHTFNIISLLGLILVLGIIVDDAIVVGEAVYVHRKKGDPPLLAATNGVMEVGLPVLAAVTTTIVAFIPLATIGGVMGKFVGIMPVAVVAALLVSLVESLFLLPAHLTHLPDPNRKIEESKNAFARRAFRIRHGISEGLEWVVEHVYIPFVRGAVRFRYVAVAVAIAVGLITIGVVSSGIVEFIVFPQMDTIEAVAGVEFPVGTPIHVTERAVKRTEESLYRLVDRLAAQGDDKTIKNVYVQIGQSSTAASSAGGLFSQSAGTHLGEIKVELYPSEERSFHSREFVAMWEQETGDIAGTLSQSFETASQGPPGAPIELWLKSENVDHIVAASAEAKEKLGTYDGVYQVKDDYRPGKREIQIDLKPEARALGLTLDDLASQVYAGFFGTEAIRFQRGRDDVRVRVRYTKDERTTLADLERVRIRTPQGNEAPFFTVADVKFDRGVSNINRVDGSRMVAVTAQVNEDRANAEKVIADLIDSGFLANLSSKYPGLRWSFEGAKKDANDAFGSLAISFPIALVGIFVIIATIFRSYVQPFVILVTVPFGLIGAVWGHYFMDRPLVMFSIFGMVALTGVVVNDAIVLIEAFNALVAKGVSTFEAIRRAGARRFRPILLTTISTCGGLTPLILETSYNAQPLVPMALSLAAGVAFATVLTLVVIPCMLAILNDLRRFAYYIWHQRWPSPDEVEPARWRNVDLLHEEPVDPAKEPATVHV